VTSVSFGLTAFKLVESGQEPGVLKTSPNSGKAESCRSSGSGFAVVPCTFALWRSGNRFPSRLSCRLLAGKSRPLRPSQWKSVVSCLRLL